MAEAICLRNAADVIEASSAGLTPLGRVEAMTKQTLERNGYSAEGLESKALLRQALEETGMVINMSGYSGKFVFEGAALVEDWPVEDPYGADAEIYQRIFEDIERRVGELAKRLRKSKGVTARESKKVGNIKKRGGSMQ